MMKIVRLVFLSLFVTLLVSPTLMGCARVAVDQSAQNPVDTPDPDVPSQDAAGGV